MVLDNVFRFHSRVTSKAQASNVFLRALRTLATQCARLWCGFHGHHILLHFEPNKLSLQCALCGYETEGWDVGHPVIARRQANSRVHAHNVTIERRGALRTVPSKARMAS
jgi:hypothetical protein